MGWVEAGGLSVVRHCSAGMTRLAIALVLSMPAWSAPIRLPDLPHRLLDVASGWSATSSEEEEAITTPTLDEALRPADIGYALVLDDVLRKKANEVDAAWDADDARPRDYLSAKAAAKLSQLLFRMTTEVSSNELAFEASTADWGTSPFNAITVNSPVAVAGPGWTGIGYGGDASAAVEHSGANSAQPDVLSRNPFFRILTSAFQYLRENREWVLGIAVAMAALAGLAGSLQARR